MEGDTSITVAGALSIAALFNNCLKCFEYIQLDRTFDGDYERCQLKIDVTKARLHRWGRAIAINEDPRFTAESHDDRFTREVKNRLRNIARIFQFLLKVSKRSKINTASKDSAYFDQKCPPRWPSLVFLGLHARLQDLPTQHQEQTDSVEKTEWMLYDSQCYDFLIWEIGSCVDALENLSSVADISCDLVESEIWDIDDEPSLLALKEAADETDDALFKAVSNKLGRIPWRNSIKNSKTKDKARQLVYRKPHSSSSTSLGKTQPEDTPCQSMHCKLISVQIPSTYSPNSRGMGVSLISALYSDDIVEVKKLIFEGTDVNNVIMYRSQYNSFLPVLDNVEYPMSRRDSSICRDLPILVAAMKSLTATKLLLDAGADVNKTWGAAGTALQVAIRHGPSDEVLKIVELLLDHGADVNAPSGGYGTALTAAARRKANHVLRVLLDKGPDVNQINAVRPYTALNTAAACTNWEAVRTLLDKGADPNIGISDRPYLYYYYRPALFFAVSQGNEEVVRWLLDAGANPNGVPLEKRLAVDDLPIAIAAQRGSLGIVKLLLNHGADIDAVGNSKCPAVIAAAMSGHADICVWLLTHGADASGAKEKWKKQLERDAIYSSVLEKHIPRELVLWEFATASAEFETAPALFQSIQSIISPWKCNEAVWQWELPEFVQGKHATIKGNVGLNLDLEVLLITTLPSTNRKEDNLSSAGRFRACTWAELGEQHLSKAWPKLRHFLEGLVGHVADNLQTMKPGIKCYVHQFTDPSFSIEVSYSWNRVSLCFDQDVQDPICAEVLRGMEVLCKAFRTSNAKEHPSVSTACWKLERYEVQTSTNNPNDSCELSRHYRLGPVMTLSNELLPLEMMQHRCWQHLFDMSSSILVNMEQRYLENFEHDGSVNSRNGKGLEVPFKIMIALAAVEFPLIIDGGVIFIGYETVLVPVSIKDDVVQFHLFTSDNRQINPYTMDLGTRLKTEDFQQFLGLRCFLGWCQFAQINLGTRALPADVKYSNGREKDRSLQLNGFSVLSQFGASAPLTAVLGVQADFKYASHRRQFTPVGSYYKLLRDTARELVIVYDSSKKQCWLVPKLSLLMHMCQAYASSVTAPGNNDMFVNGHADATELIEDLEPLGDHPVFGEPTDGFLFRQLILGLNLNLLTTVKAIQKSSSGKLYGFEFMDVVSSPGRGTCMKALPISSTGRNWLGIVNVVDAVIVCSNIGAVITTIPNNSGTAPVRNNPICNGLPEGLDYLAATVPCLNRLVGRQGSKLTLNSGSERIMVSKECFWDIEGALLTRPEQP